LSGIQGQRLNRSQTQTHRTDNEVDKKKERFTGLCHFGPISDVPDDDVVENDDAKHVDVGDDFFSDIADNYGKLANETERRCKVFHVS